MLAGVGVNLFMEFSIVFLRNSSMLRMCILANVMKTNYPADDFVWRRDGAVEIK